MDSFCQANSKLPSCFVSCDKVNLLEVVPERNKTQSRNNKAETPQILTSILFLVSFQDHISVPYQPDSSSNPSSTTSSTPSSPAPPLPSSATPPSPLHPSPQSARQQKQFNLTGTRDFLSFQSEMFKKIPTFF